MLRPHPAWALGALIPLVAVSIYAAVGGVLHSRADARSDPYIRAAEFHVLSGCPTRAVYLMALPSRCVDPRYRIRHSPDRYGLPFRNKSSGWIRIGPDAAALVCGFGCSVVGIRTNWFPHPDGARR